MTIAAADREAAPGETRGADRRAAAEVLDLAVRAARDHGHPDLAAALARDGGRLLDPGARVLVLGDYKQGKSSLVDALLDASVCPVHPDVATAVPMLVGHAEEPRAVLVGPDERVEVTAARLAEAVTGRGEGHGSGGTAWHQAEIGLPIPLLGEGLTLVDTPGAGGLGAAPALSTLADLPAADAVVLVSDASRELGAGEIDLLRAAVDHCATVVVALTRTDLHPAWREVRDLDLALLAEHGLGTVDLLPVSAALYRHAVDRGDDELGAESGVPALRELLRSRVVEPVAGRTGRAVGDEVAAVLDQVRAAPAAECAVLEGGERARELDADLAAATERAAALKRRSARWQQTLADGIADLNADVEWDLRDRIRHVVRVAEETLEVVDPARTWDQFDPWLTEEIGRAAATTFLWAGERTWWLAERVGAHFADVPALPAPGSTDPAALPVGRAELPPVPELAAPDLEGFGLTQGILTGLRGSYGGVLMVGLVTTLSGMALINPFSIGAGLLLGGRTVRDERRRALRRRRLDARGVVRRHADEVQFVLGKHAKDMLREVQRMLRDHFAARAEEATTTAAAAVAAASAARELDTGVRKRRLAEVRAELAHLDALVVRCRNLSSGVER